MKKEHVINRQGKDFVLYTGLLEEAHAQGLKRVSTDLIQIPSEENGNVAIVHAEVETTKGIFAGIGDAAPGNVNRMILPHLIRMAETRAKARAMRDAINIDMTALEELSDGEEEVDQETGEITPKKPAEQHNGNVVDIRSVRTRLKGLTAQLLKARGKGETDKQLLTIAAKEVGITDWPGIDQASDADVIKVGKWVKSQLDIKANSEPEAYDF